MIARHHSLSSRHHGECVFYSSSLKSYNLKNKQFSLSVLSRLFSVIVCKFLIVKLFVYFRFVDIYLCVICVSLYLFIVRMSNKGRNRSPLSENTLVKNIITSGVQFLDVD